MEHGLKFFLPALLLSASILDLMYSKIPNILNYPFMAGGVLHHAYMRGMEGFVFSLEGLGLGIALLLFFYLAGGMGAGDVKLMGAIGSFFGAGRGVQGLPDQCRYRGVLCSPPHHHLWKIERVHE